MKRCSPDQIVVKLHQADRELGKGLSVKEVCRAIEVSDHTYYRWRQKYGRRVFCACGPRERLEGRKGLVICRSCGGRSFFSHGSGGTLGALLADGDKGGCGDALTNKHQVTVDPASVCSRAGRLGPGGWGGARARR
ncbi:MAG: transposase [Phycisphaerae bacterium]|nr:transposase [Phycisphaerae bacterium]